MNIFLTALATIFTNLGTALKVSVIPFFIGIILTTIVVAPVATIAESSPNLSNTEFSPVLIILMVLFMLALWLTVMAVIAINWHRAILYNETVGFLPNLRDLPLWSYIGRLIIISIIAAVIAFAASLLVSVIFGGLGLAGRAPMIIAGIIGLAIFVLFIGFTTRLASTLPAIAVGHQQSITEGLEQTRDIAGQIYGSVICTLIFGAVIGLVSILFVQLPLISAIYSLASNWLTTMLGLAVLTVIYRRTGFEAERPD